MKIGFHKKKDPVVVENRRLIPLKKNQDLVNTTKTNESPQTQRNFTSNIQKVRKQNTHYNPQEQYLKDRDAEEESGIIKHGPKSMSNSETAKISLNPLAIPLQANNASSSSSTKSDLQRSSSSSSSTLKRGNGSLSFSL